jgi:3-oxoacyl-[acyl-carrier-protein] synthase-3
MDGKAVWDFATTAFPNTVRTLCADAGVTLDDIRLVVPHQANANVIRESARRLELPMDRVAMNVDRCGNTLAASIPMALDEALRNGRAGPGDLVILVAFGGGLAWGGILLEL